MEQRPAETTVYSMSDEPPPAPNRRSGERHMTLFRVAALITPERRDLCLLKNISAGGALIRAYSELSQNQKVKLELKERQAIPAEISWVRGSDAGMRFDRKIDLIDLLSANSQAAKPRMPRLEVRAFAYIRQGALLHRAIINNISQGGLNAECTADLAIGCDVTVSLAGLPPQQGIVRWGDNGSYGITFNIVLGLPVLVEWLQNHSSTGSPGA